MKIVDMTNQETAAHLREYIADHKNYFRYFSWPTDACGYDQHIKFVKHRNKNWHGSTKEAWDKFVLDYADSLEASNEH